MFYYIYKKSVGNHFLFLILVRHLAGSLSHVTLGKRTWKRSFLRVIAVCQGAGEAGLGVHTSNASTRERQGVPEFKAIHGYTVRLG